VTSAAPCGNGNGAICCDVTLQATRAGDRLQMRRIVTTEWDFACITREVESVSIVLRPVAPEDAAARGSISFKESNQAPGSARPFQTRVDNFAVHVMNSKSILFLHIPKTAGTSLKHYLFHRYSANQWIPTRRLSSKPFSETMHLSPAISISIK
jgi:hypothetical protein